VTAPDPPLRTVVQSDALAWLEDNPARPATGVVTSLPDMSELPELGFDAWRTWFVDASRRVIRWLPEGGAAVFYQSDVRHRGLWVDKAHLVSCAADLEHAPLLFHRIVCRKPAGTETHGRASYAHMIAVSRALLPAAKRPYPDVLPDAGLMPWSRAMGAEACLLACNWLRLETAAQTIVDPFCGQGTVLAVANTLGLDAIGVERCARRCRRARTLRLP
jgi:hypothetical protein